MNSVAIELGDENESLNSFNSNEFRRRESSESRSVTETPTEQSSKSRKLAVRQRRVKK